MSGMLPGEWPVPEPLVFTSDGPPPPPFRLFIPPWPVKKFMNLNRGGTDNWRVQRICRDFWADQVVQACELYRSENGWPALPQYQRAHVTLTYVYSTHTKRDTHNWAPTSKFIVDGIKAMGFIPDDNDYVLIGPDNRPGLDLSLPNHTIAMVIDIRGLEEDEWIWWEAP